MQYREDLRKTVEKGKHNKQVVSLYSYFYVQAWQDYKKNVKSKASRIKNDRNQTGGGLPIEVFDPTETQVLDLITETEIGRINSLRIYSRI